MMFGVANIRVPAAGLAAGRLGPVDRRDEAPGHDRERVGRERHPDAAVLVAVDRAVLQRDRGHRHPRAGQPDDPGLLPDGGTSSVSVAAAGGFVGVLSLFNMAGRFAWSSTSDLIGRKPIYMVYLGVGMVTVPAARPGRSTRDGAVRAAGRRDPVASTAAASRPCRPTCATSSAPTRSGAIHGRLLTAWSAAGVAGPLIINGFLDAQGKPGSLTSAAYQPALFTMVGVLAIGFVANLLIRPVAGPFPRARARRSRGCRGLLAQ